MPIYTVTLLRNEEVAAGTMAFHFEKPAGFAYTAGQFGDFTELHPAQTDEEGNIRGFSLASAPCEPDLMIATRMRDTAFKRVLKSLPVGTPVKLDAPYGDFVLHKTVTTPVVFLTGGIGITPARSMIVQATKDKLPRKLTLFYANRTPQDASFLHGLEKWAQENPYLTFVPVMTKTTPQQWDGEHGYIDKHMLMKYVADVMTPIYYLSGPAGMVAAMRQLLTEAHVSEDHIRTEEFSGY
jgi:ferredoxin-NADP reductase